MTVVLIGVPGSGKTCVARELQARGYVAADTDQIVAERASVTGKDLYVLVEPERRRKLSEQVLVELIDDASPEGKFAIAVSSEALWEGSEAVRALRTYGDAGARVVWLTADLSSLVRRNGMLGQHSGAIVMPRRHFRELMDAKRAVFESVASETVDTSEMTADQVAALLA
ncbi:shikimate kinase [Arcanobacterium wilhelmae]|uniref:Shikimate kinase n=1 Tax=Arcanobacterium wilhelmae TaxID=1803177 RepID=A0ABT9N8K7_9ACTO|nr:AAA family ATPase [Arcanobacterium wilhelmae]MDP9800035.1 shikimate kinase [Arcanobacterium wilhelmae]